MEGQGSNPRPLAWTLVGLVVLLLAGGPWFARGQHLVPSLRRDPGLTLKQYSGVRVRPESHRQVYYCDQTIAIVELGPGKELFNCELIEVYADAKLALQMKNLSSISRPIRISFPEMKNLMHLCQMLDLPRPSAPQARALRNTDGEATERPEQAMNALSLFSGILPGTKWCGTGDIADTYFDMGEYTDIDKCCRTHDLCPTKVRAFTSRYNLTNYSLYTKSHCACDSAFYDCLKATNNPTANVMGNLYFNIVRVPCIEDVGCHGENCRRIKQFRAARKHF